MEQEKLKLVKGKIVEFIRQNGPSLPIHISREVGLTTLFASAFLSELSKEKIIRISDMKVGGSPLYYLPGQETQLEKFSNHLPLKEREALNLLNNEGVLQDEQLEPAIRVALRSLKDFAIPFKYKEKIFWRHISLSPEQVKDELIPKKKQKSEEKQAEEKKQAKEETEEKQEEQKEDKEETKPEEKPLLQIKKQEKSKPKKKQSEFTLKVINYLESNDIELLKEIEQKKREFIGKIRINSDLGKISLLLIAKDKKRISDTDLRVGKEKSQSKKMPLFFLTKGKLTKKAEKYLEIWRNFIILKKFE